jgi:predicted unusual protein kinase regulating ubiquinone biosynthesis (AarF/ABC1/UbiB family)
MHNANDTIFRLLPARNVELQRVLALSGSDLSFLVELMLAGDAAHHLWKLASKYTGIVTMRRNTNRLGLADDLVRRAGTMARSANAVTGFCRTTISCQNKLNRHKEKVTTYGDQTEAEDAGRVAHNLLGLYQGWQYQYQCQYQRHCRCRCQRQLRC